MIIDNVFQPTFDEVLKEHADIIICSSGYETRSSYLAPRFKDIKAQRISLGHREHCQVRRRKHNDSIYRKLGYDQHIISGNSANEAQAKLIELLDNIKKASCKLIIDISSMTGAWYGAFIQAFRNQVKFNEIVVDFIYVPTTFQTRLRSYPPHDIIGPVNGFAGYAMSDKPTSLIIGLGQDKGRALGIKEALDPYSTYAFYTNPAVDERYFPRILKANNEFLESINPDCILTYPLSDAVASFNILDSLCAGLLKESRLVLTSIGPKIFGLYCFLLATKYPETSVWRISAGARGNNSDKLPSNEIIPFRVKWTKDP